MFEAYLYEFLKRHSPKSKRFVELLREARPLILEQLASAKAFGDDEYAQLCQQLLDTCDECEARFGMLN